MTRAARRVAVLDSAGGVLAEADFGKRIRRDHEQWVHVIVSSDRPLSVCGAPDHAVAIPGGVDTMFVLSGSLPEGAIC